MGAISPEERQIQRMRSPVGGKYDTAINRESAYEKLAARAQAEGQRAPVPSAAPSANTGPAPTPNATAEEANPITKKLSEWMFGTSRRQGAVEAMAKSAMRTAGNQLSRKLLRGVLGGLMK